MTTMMKIVVTLALIAVYMVLHMIDAIFDTGFLPAGISIGLLVVISSL